MSKIVLITGASSGLGKATSEFLSSKGYKVYGTSRDPSKYTSPSSYKLLKLDVNDVASIDFTINFILKKEKRIDLLINNAGVGITGPGEETDVSEMKKNFNTNFFGAVLLMQKVLPTMRDNKKGLIINISSIAGYMGLPYRGCYSASKGALQLFTESIRMEVKKFGVDILTLAPGAFSTNIADRRYHSPIKNGPYKDDYKKSLEEMNKHVSDGSNPLEIAEFIYNLSNNESKYRVHYKIGAWLQKFSLILKKILPDTVYEKILMSFYKI
ncbi:MAG: short-chain dehydrogenase/reductase [Flavobacteriaceae bacterium]|nr:short-chain dehydrogenase/reductase [Flavobacteriaceae bacterium]|tara:strand:- start:2105 stop:2911 length:807 start_codon:yes stop_codon:yes gene_type:complete